MYLEAGLCCQDDDYGGQSIEDPKIDFFRASGVKAGAETVHGSSFEAYIMKGY